MASHEKRKAGSDEGCDNDNSGRRKILKKTGLFEEEAKAAAPTDADPIATLSTVPAAVSVSAASDPAATGPAGEMDLDEREEEIKTPDIKSILRRHQSKAGALSKSVRAMTAKTVAACSKDLAELGLAAMSNIYGGEYGEGETEATVIKTVLPGVSKSSL